MQKVIPVFYSEYGRYIARFRAIPLFIDGLKPVERRLLLSLHETASNKYVKSAKVVGHVIGSYHPHGDQSAYGSLVDMVKRGLVLGEGNFGTEGLEDDPPAAMRYTEVKAQPWVNNMAFRYCDPKFIPWKDLELDLEPMYLPSPLPIGLIGDGVISGIAFSTTTIPRYKSKDLAKRLVWILEKTIAKDGIRGFDMEADFDPVQVGPIIKPSILNCSTVETEKNAYIKLLIKGWGSIRVIPNGNINSKKKEIHINGKAPLRHGFGVLAKKCDGVDSKGKPAKSGTIDAKIKDLSKSIVDIAVFPDKPRVQNLNKLATQVWEVVSPNIVFNCQYCDFEGKIHQLGIDQILVTCYNYWKDAVLKKKVYDTLRLFDKFYEMHIIYYIRQLDINTITNVDDVVNKLIANGVTSQPVNCETFDYIRNQWTVSPKTINETDIRSVCQNKNIKQLIEVNIDFTTIANKINEHKALITNNETDCLTELKTLM
jgi:hypothetical protein